MQALKEQLSSMSSTRKLLFVILIALSSLFFYAFGIVTGFFGSPVFSVFWVVSNQTAYFIGYAVLASATVTTVIISVYWAFRKFQLKFEPAFTRQKLLVISIITVYSLIFYAIGIATNLFDAPMFSMFRIISSQTAHELAFGIGAIAIVLSIVILSFHFLKGQKNIFPEPVFTKGGASNEATLNSPVLNETEGKTAG